MTITLVRTDEGFNLIDPNNKRVGYVEDGKLYGFDNTGYAVEVGSVEHSIEIAPKLQAWMQLQAQKDLGI